MARHRSPRPTAPWSTLPTASLPAPAAGPVVGGFRVGLAGARSAPSLPAHPLEPSSADTVALAVPPGPRPSGPRPAPRRPSGGPATSALLRSRLAVAAVAAGALATAGHGLAATATAVPEAPSGALALRASSLGTDPAPATPTPRRTARTDDATTTGVLPVAGPAPTRTASPDAVGTASGQVGSLSKSRRMADLAAARTAAAAAPEFVKPAEGRFTSGFGARWGTSHLGIDLANAIGTPIVSVGDGTVVESGPASGFGMWVRVRLTDGTITVYGHVNRSFVTAGDTVEAGQEIAEIGNRGQSTGPHLHFEVWTPAGKKINPLPWLAERGIDVGGSAGGGASD